MSLIALGGCAALLPAQDGTTGERHQTPPWVRALYPSTERSEIRIDRYPGQMVLVYGDRIYGSTGDDMPGQVFGMLIGLALSPTGPRMLSVGQVGFGTGISVGVALAAGSRMVDVFEQDTRLVEAGAETAGISGLTYQADRPLHPSLRVVTPEDAASEHFLRYDVLLSPPATSVIGGPANLVTVERLEALGSLLGSQGVLVHHLPAYGMQPEIYRRFLRTFARAFPYVLVFVAEPGSGDTFLVGSNTALLFRPVALRTLSDNPALADLWRAARLDQPMDLAARLVFASRQEVLDFAEGAVSISERTPLEPDDLPQPPPVPPPDAPASERHAWEDAREQYDRRHERMTLLRQQMDGLDWVYGQVCPEGPGTRDCLLAVPAGDEGAAAQVAALALSLMAAGRFVEARLTLEACWDAAQDESLRAPIEVMTYLLEEPLDLAAQLPEALSPVREPLAGGRCNEALAAAEPLLATSASGALEDRLVLAYALVRCRPEEPDAMETVRAILEPAEGASVPASPLLSYLRARSAVVRGDYPAAVRHMREYVESRPRQPVEEP